MKKVDFIVVGVQKSGTTALHNYLSKHPQIFLPQKKELHFFDNESYFVNHSVDYSLYHQNFDFKPIFKVFGEITPIYSYWDNAIKRIYEYNKKIKIILILRNPIERAFSHWKMEYKRGLDTIDFYEALLNENHRSKEALPDKHRVYSYVDRGFYSEQIRNIYRYYDKNNVLILYNEELLNKPYEVLNTICSFLSLEPFKSINKELVFESNYERKMKIKEYSFLHQKFQAEVFSLSVMLQKELTHWLEIKKKKVLFYRDYRGYQGGHQKVYDYYTHLKEHPYFDVDIVFSNESIFDKTNPWKNEAVRQTYNLDDYDMFFIAGEDWKILENYDYAEKTVINLIQGLRHSTKNTFLYECLKNKAIRITVSPDLFASIEATKQVNSCLYTIPNGISIENKMIKKNYDFFILGVKNKKIAKLLEERLKDDNFSVKCTCSITVKENIQRYMSEAKITILLPFSEEGFYLPALEAMALSDITIVPDCIGNRSFCLDKVNCLMPDYNVEMLYKNAIEAYKKHTSTEYEFLKENALKTVQQHSLQEERERFYKILDELEYE